MHPAEAASKLPKPPARRTARGTKRLERLGSSLGTPWSCLIGTLLLGCSEYGLNPNAAQPPGSSRDDTAGTYGYVSVVTEVEAPSCPNKVEGLTALPAPTCGPVDFVGFDMIIERSFTHSDRDGYPYMSAPITFVEGGRIRVAAGSKYSETRADAFPDILLVDGATATRSGALELNGGEPMHLASGRAFRTNDDPGETVVGWGTWDPPSAAAVVDSATGTTETLDELPWVGTYAMLRDVDFDGAPDVAIGGIVASQLGRTWSFLGDGLSPIGPVLFDASGTGDLRLATGLGIGNLETEKTVRWAWPEGAAPQWINVAIAGIDGAPAQVVLDGNYFMLETTSGPVDLSLHDRWVKEMRSQGEPFAVGDIDGDGHPDAVFQATGNIVAKHLDGAQQGMTFQSWPVLDPTVGGVAPVVLADLDADGDYEVFTLTTFGAFLFDGESGATLWSDTTLRTLANFASPLVADVDGDGSVEIVFPCDIHDGIEPYWQGELANDTLVVLGAAEGRFARGRPVWNQVPYDITTVRDDGALVRFPRPSWQQYNAFRAQPAHDGDHPDLAPRVTEACADVCGPGGTVTLTVVVDNLGSQEAAAGAAVALSTWADGDAWIAELARITLPDVVPAGGTSPALQFTVPWEQWKDARVVDVWGTHEDECDYVNDRIDVAEDPCAE